MRPNNHGKTGPVNFKREMARRARLDKEEEARRRFGPPKRGRPRKVGLPFDPTKPSRRKRLAITTERPCRVCGIVFRSIRPDATLCSARCRKRASRMEQAKKRAQKSLDVTLKPLANQSPDLISGPKNSALWLKT